MNLAATTRRPRVAHLAAAAALFAAATLGLGPLGRFGGPTQVRSAAAAPAPAPATATVRAAAPAPAPAKRPAAPATAAKALPRPILFVHGFDGTPMDFDTLRVRLEAAGFPADRIHALALPDGWFGSNHEDALEIARAVDAVRAHHGVAQVTIVAHSMGNLAVRHYLKAHAGARYVHTYVSIGGMHHGLRGEASPCEAPHGLLAYFDELCGDGEFVGELAHGDETPGATLYASIYSLDDEIVPPESAVLPGAVNYGVRDLGHSGRFGLLEDPRVAGIVLAWVR